jgi:hypothetical protein
MTLLYSAAVRLQARPVRRHRLSFRFSEGFAGSDQSATGRLTGPYDTVAALTVQDQPHISTAVVSEALARSAAGKRRARWVPVAGQPGLLEI